METHFMDHAEHIPQTREQIREEFLQGVREEFPDIDLSPGSPLYLLADGTGECWAKLERLLTGRNTASPVSRP